MPTIEKIGITERGDAALDLSWMSWVQADKPTILITKDPLTLCRVIKENDLQEKRIIVHATITGFGGTILEPDVLPAKDQIIGYNHLLQMLTPQRVILRVDPIIPTEKGLEAALLVLRHAVKRRVRISFMDFYRHVQTRFRKVGLPIPYVYTDGFTTNMHAGLEYRKEALKRIIDLIQTMPEICGEPDMPGTGCINEFDCKILGVVPGGGTNIRRGCACLSNKHELLTERKRCKHNCLYCYWKG